MVNTHTALYFLAGLPTCIPASNEDQSSERKNGLTATFLRAVPILPHNTSLFLNLHSQSAPVYSQMTECVVD